MLDLKPDTIAINRKASTGQSNTGTDTFGAPSVLNSGIRTLVDPMVASSRMGGDLYVTIEGQVYLQTHEAFVDALMPYQFDGLDPGDTVVFEGVTYTVAANGRNAFVDIVADDDVQDQNGRHFLVLAVAEYYDAGACLELRLAFGRSWFVS
jgi:hypothetical protein